jgi:hypothetical protein
MKKMMKNLFFVLSVIVFLLSGCIQSPVTISVNDTIPIESSVKPSVAPSVASLATDTSTVVVEPHPFIKGVQPRVDILADLLEKEGINFVRIYTTEEETDVINGKTKVGIWVSWYEDFPKDSVVFIPLSDNVLKEGVCPDQQLMARTFLQTKPKFEKKMVNNVVKSLTKETFPIIIRVWQNIGPAKEMFCKDGSNSRDNTINTLAGSPRHQGNVNMKVVFYGADSTFDAPEGFKKVDGFFGSRWERTISFSSTKGEYQINVDPRWLGKGIVKIYSKDRDVVYPPYGVVMETYSGELLKEFKNNQECPINFVYKVK